MNKYAEFSKAKEIFYKNAGRRIYSKQKCANKHSYCKEIAMEKAKSESERLGIKMKYYHCGLCGRWHIAKKNPHRAEVAV